MAEYFFFWKHRLSQWHMVDFTMDGTTYCCAEQAMMYKKSLLFNDMETAKNIMETKSPQQHQKLGRTVKNFSQAIWDENKERIVYEINKARFSQSYFCRTVLFATGDAILCEASPFDRVWGVGLGKNDPLIQNEANWRGQNLLGKILTKVRDDLRKQYEK